MNLPGFQPDPIPKTGSTHMVLAVIQRETLKNISRDMKLKCGALTSIPTNTMKKQCRM